MRKAVLFGVLVVLVLSFTALQASGGSCRVILESITRLEYKGVGEDFFFSITVNGKKFLVSQYTREMLLWDEEIPDETILTITATVTEHDDVYTDLGSKILPISVRPDAAGTYTYGLDVRVTEYKGYWVRSEYADWRFTIRVIVIGEPDYFALLSNYIKLYKSEFAIIRKKTIDIFDLPLLDIWCSEGAMCAIYQHCPITSWQQLHDIKYISAASSTGTPQAAVSESQALIFLLVFDLTMGPEDWPWK
jgi:hypothetical protein